jgi:hypothetical protein
VSRFICTRLRGLADEVGTLKERVRIAVAGELAGAVAGAVQDVVRAAVAGRPLPAPRTPARSRSSDTWADDRDSWDDDSDDDGRPGTARGTLRPDEFASGERVVALAAAVQVGRWWLARRGSVLGATGIGLAAAITGLFGGAVVRAGLTALGVTTDLLAVTASLGDGARAIDED